MRFFFSWLSMKYNVRITPDALRINRSSCVHKEFTYRSPCVHRSHFTCVGAPFALCVCSPFTVHKRSPNSVQCALIVCLECAHRLLGVSSPFICCSSEKSRTFQGKIIIQQLAGQVISYVGNGIKRYKY